MKKYAEWTRNTRLKHISLDKENKRVITFWRPNIKIQSLKDSNLSVLQEVNYLENWLCAPEVHKVGAKSRGNTNCPEVKNCSFMFIQYLAQWGTHPKKHNTSHDARIGHGLTHGSAAPLWAWFPSSPSQAQAARQGCSTSFPVTWTAWERQRSHREDQIHGKTHFNKRLYVSGKSLVWGCPFFWQ